MAASLKPAGRLLVLDILSVRNVFTNAVALLLSFDPTKPWKLRRAYSRHGKDETHLTLDEVQRIAHDALPGAVVRAHLRWRYSAVWQRIAA